MKIIQKIVIVLSILVILFGFYQLKNENDIFAQSKQQCCNNSQCKYDNGNGSLCTSLSSMDLEPKCIAYLLTCKDCVDYSAAGMVCGDPKNSCIDRGSCYGWCYKNGTWQWIIAK